MYYKRATAQLSLGRHALSLEDFDKVLSLTSNTFPNAHLMKAKIYAKEGSFTLARESLSQFLSAHPTDSSAKTLQAEIDSAEQQMKKRIVIKAKQMPAKPDSATITAALASLGRAGSSENPRTKNRARELIGKVLQWSQRYLIKPDHIKIGRAHV